MGNIFKKYGSLLLAFIACFTLGGYTDSSLKYNENIEAHRWVLTSVFGLMFLINFLANQQEK